MLRKSKPKYQISWKIRNCLYLNIYKIYLFALFKKIQMSDHGQLSIRALAQQLSARSSDVTAPPCPPLSTPHTEKHTLSSACSPSGTCWPLPSPYPCPVPSSPETLRLLSIHLEWSFLPSLLHWLCSPLLTSSRHTLLSASSCVILSRDTVMLMSDLWQATQKHTLWATVFSCAEGLIAADKKWGLECDSSCLSSFKVQNIFFLIN